MSVAAMTKVNIFFKSADSEAVISKLQDLGVVQLGETMPAESQELEPVTVDEAQAQAEYLRAGLKFSIDYLTPYEPKQGSFLDRLVAAKPIFSQSKLEQTIKETDHAKLVEQVQQLESSINEVRNEQNALAQEQEQLRQWSGLTFVPSHEAMPAGFDYLLASHGNGGYEELRSACRAAGLVFDSQLVNQEAKSDYFYIIYRQGDKKKIEEILSQGGAELIEIDDMTETVPVRQKETTARLKELDNQLAKHEQMARDLAKKLPELRAGYDYYSWARERLEAYAQARQTDTVATLSGWVELSNVDKLEQSLSKVTSSSAVVETQFSADEEPPVQMRNRRWARPFEAITGIYGSPQYGEPDPTAWLAPFFVIFFGLALTDTGYGLILAGLAALGLKFMAHTPEAKKLMKVLLIGGLMTAVLGVLFGGWMGIVLDDLPASGIKSTLLGLRLVDPIANPIAVLLVTFALGIVQVIVGLLVNLRWQLKQGKKQEAVLGSGVWLLFLTLLVLWILGNVGLLPVAVAAIITKALLGAVVLVVLAGTRKTKNWLLKLPVGVLSLYDLVGYFSDVLSYSRLLALGLGTGIIAMVVNLIARIAVDMVPVVGWVFFVLILIGGHVFNIAINVLGAYIHSSRLQFVEFFPKFMEGGGRTFSPFRRESQYIRVSD